MTIARENRSRQLFNRLMLIAARCVIARQLKIHDLTQHAPAMAYSQRKL